VAQEQDDGYAGPAQVVVGTERHAVRAVLAARFEPVLGRVAWSGRVEGIPGVLTAGTEVVVRTPHGEARATATEPDLWGHWHLRSADPPPFAVELLGDAERP
jgi:hypothetical protein